MKKIVVSLIACLVIALFSACGNMSIGPGNYQFEGLHFADHAGNTRDFTILKWYEGGQGIEVQTEEAGSMFFSEGTYILYEDTCPVCGKEEHHAE